jgi:hypothetical protein
MERRGRKSQHPPQAISQSCRVVESNQQANRHTAGKIEAHGAKAGPAVSFGSITGRRWLMLGRRCVIESLAMRHLDRYCVAVAGF